MTLAVLISLDIKKMEPYGNFYLPGFPILGKIKVILNKPTIRRISCQATKNDEDVVNVKFPHDRVSLVL
jgi:hypothetical protein